MKIKLTHREAMEKIKELQTICKKIQKERDYYKNIVKNAKKKSDYDLLEFLKGFGK